jgi:hypothetical protein
MRVVISIVSTLIINDDEMNAIATGTSLKGNWSMLFGTEK